MLIDQSRPFEGDGNGKTEGDGKYKTRNNKVHDNETTFEGDACSGGASDAEPGDGNFTIITDGNNLFDSNVYRVPRVSGPPRLALAHAILDWYGLRANGVQQNRQL